MPTPVMTSMEAEAPVVILEAMVEIRETTTTKVGC